MQTHGLSERQACRVLNLSRSVLHYQARKSDNTEITQILLELAERKLRWGFGKMLAYLKKPAKGLEP